MYNTVARHSRPREEEKTLIYSFWLQHLVWHRRRSDLILDHLELEVVHGHILPHISAEVDQDGVDALQNKAKRPTGKTSTNTNLSDFPHHHHMEHFSKVIVGRNLCGELFSLHLKCLSEEMAVRLS